MLHFNIKRLLELRGIDKPHAFFVKNGFTHQMASNLSHNRIGHITTRQLEKLCALFHCTPNDLFDWQPTDDARAAANHPLATLTKAKPVRISEIVKEIPADKLHRIEALLNDLKNED